MEDIRLLIEQTLAEAGMSATAAANATFITILLLLGMAAWFVGYTAHKFLTPAIIRIAMKTKTVLDDYFLNEPVLKAVWHIVPGVLFRTFLPSCYGPATSPLTVAILEKAANIYITLTFILFFRAFLDNIVAYTSDQERLKMHHLLGITQFLKLTTYLVGAIVVTAILLGRDPLGLIAGLGAAATVLMFIFKDTIMGLVAGIQLSAAKMLKPGDWVTVERLGINGVVETVTLITVKIRNFDNTITTVPPYTLVSEAFQNWDGMKVRHARRVKRALRIDMTSIRRLNSEEVRHLADGGYLGPDTAEAAAAAPINLTLFRHYAEDFLRRHPEVVHEESGQWLMARQLEPTSEGLPLELWFYFREIEFVRYEDLAAEVMEHLIAALPAFGLRLFQLPGGNDFARLLHRKN